MGNNLFYGLVKRPTLFNAHHFISIGFRFQGCSNGAKFLKGWDLSQMDCEAAVLLMSCRSGAFDSWGDMESNGIIYDYHKAKW